MRVVVGLLIGSFKTLLPSMMPTFPFKTWHNCVFSSWTALIAEQNDAGLDITLSAIACTRIAMLLYCYL